MKNFLRAMSIPFAVFVIVVMLGASDCDTSSSTPTVSASGAKKLVADVPLNAAGHTVEQENVKNRLMADNKPGAIKHLYVISAYSGQVIIYSTVKGKVTSSGKRLSPTSVHSGDGRYHGSDHEGIPVAIGGSWHHTSEVLQDDGTYGSSIRYLFWWDSQGRYHQHYVSGGQIIHISDQPLVVPGIIINMEMSNVVSE